MQQQHQTQKTSKSEMQISINLCNCIPSASLGQLFNTLDRGTLGIFYKMKNSIFWVLRSSMVE